MDWHAAVNASRVGVSLDIEVVPGSSESLFPVGYNKWRKRLEAKVKAPPQDGEANAELCALVAEVLGIAVADLRVSSGEKSRKKTLLAHGTTVDAVRARLAPYF